MPHYLDKCSYRAINPLTGSAILDESRSTVEALARKQWAGVSFRLFLVDAYGADLLELKA